MDMTLHIAEDFALSLSELETTLKFSKKNRDPIAARLIEDAQIYSFQRTLMRFKDFLFETFDEGDDDMDYEAQQESLLAIMTLLHINEFIDEDQLVMFGALFASEIIFFSGREQFEENNEGHIFEAAYENIPAYYGLMSELFDGLSESDDEDSDEDEDEN